MSTGVASNMEILRSFIWNDQDYTVVERDDGTRIELRCTAKEAPEIMAKLTSIPEPAPEPEKLEITAYSDKVLLAEVKRRDLVLAVSTETK